MLNLYLFSRYKKAKNRFGRVTKINSNLIKNIANFLAEMSQVFIDASKNLIITRLNQAKIFRTSINPNEDSNLKQLNVSLSCFYRIKNIMLFTHYVIDGISRSSQRKYSRQECYEYRLHIKGTKNNSSNERQEEGYMKKISGWL